MDSQYCSNPEALFQKAFSLHQAGHLEQAVEIYRFLNKLAPNSPQVLLCLAEARGGQGHSGESLRLLDKVLRLNPCDPLVHNIRGNVLAQLERQPEAVQSYCRAIELAPEYAEAHNNLGNLYRELGQGAKAIACYEQAIRTREDFAEAYSNLGNVLRGQGDIRQARSCYERAIEHRPDYADAHYNLGVLLQELLDFSGAIASYEKATHLQPNHFDAYYNLGIIFNRTLRYSAALSVYEQALRLKPENVEVLCGIRIALMALNRWQEALEYTKRALSLQPDFECLYGDYLTIRMQLCEWSEWLLSKERASQYIASGAPTTAPFVGHFALESPSSHLKNAEIHAVLKRAVATKVSAAVKHARHDRIRVAYFSTDFCNHPVSHLLAGLFEMHDRGRFDVLGFSLVRHQDAWTERVAGAFDRFFDVQESTDAEIVALARSLEIDIAIDLNGYTQGCRPSIFAERVAPIQASYIGFLGTMGTPCIDYLIADSLLVPDDKQAFYSEKIAYLPCYQCNDHKTFPPDSTPSRLDMGLPEEGTVFCSFNSNYKISPEVFDSWMRILVQVPKSVLWLFVSNEVAAGNLRQEAVKRGVDAHRLVFAQRLPLEAHLARHRLADLFLDTYPYNAGATASNALRMGVPVLTRAGESFPSRYGASLLNAVGIPELVAMTERDYEGLAISLGNDADAMKQLRQKLAEKLPGCALFDTSGFARSIEKLFSLMYERYQAGLPPDHLHVT